MTIRFRLLPALVAIWAACAAPAAMADEFVLCLQNQLKTLGYDPGPLDGAWGGKTKNAAISMRAATPALSGMASLKHPRRVSAISWCRETGVAHSKTRKFYPSATKSTVLTDRDTRKSMASLLRNTSQKAQKFLNKTYGITLASRIDFVAGADIDQLIQNNKALAQSRHFSTKGLSGIVNKHCDFKSELDGFALNHWITICWQKKAVRNANWSRLQHAITHFMVHEFVHVYQTEYALIKTTGESRNYGPNWMVEGAAMMATQEFESRGLKRTDLGALHKAAQTSNKSLSNLRSVSSRSDYALSEYAVILLAKRYGTRRVMDYWRRIGEGRSPAKAFKTQFGMSQRSYEKLFKKMRNDPKAATTFAAGTS